MIEKNGGVWFSSTPLPHSTVTKIIDSTSYTFYRVTATGAWWALQGHIPVKDIIPDSPEHTEFLQHMEQQSLSCLQKFCKIIGVQPADILFIRDCPRESIWRLKHYDKYKANRDSTAPTTYGQYIKHLNAFHATIVLTKLRLTMSLPYLYNISNTWIPNAKYPS